MVWMLDVTCIISLDIVLIFSVYNSWQALALIILSLIRKKKSPYARVTWSMVLQLTQAKLDSRKCHPVRFSATGYASVLTALRFA